MTARTPPSLFCISVGTGVEIFLDCLTPVIPVLCSHALLQCVDAGRGLHLSPSLRGFVSVKIEFILA
jgi:hypothetical protein